MTMRYNTSRVARQAWGILIASFVLFWVLCIGLSLGLYTFLFASTVPMPARVEVGRGTALLITPDLAERGVRTGENITGRTVTLSMDSQSQAVVSFFNSDDDKARQTLATVTLFASSEVRFNQATMPRFDWTDAIYRVSLRDFRGQMEVVITDDGRRPFRMQILTESGRLIDLNGAGRYSIESNATRVRVTTLRGEAVLFSNDRTQNRLIPSGSEGVLYAERTAPSVYPSRRNLINNGMFVFMNDPVSLVLPERWGCTNAQDDLPRGGYVMDRVTGRPMLRLVRGVPASSHGETRCIQPISANSGDISPFNFLELETSFVINHQSLPDCGERGSECPLMLRVNYIDVNGSERAWFQGFYTMSNPALGYPPRCESCTQDHLQINPRVLYTYRTGNLFATIPASARPVRITSVEFYASGHQYDVLVNEIGMYVGYVDTVPDFSGS
jgi:uncharacterized protein YdbL (DUF1318 family)